MNRAPTQTSQEFNELKARVKAIPIVEVVGKYLTLARKGSEYSARCPFHVEQTPSFSVVPKGNFYHCFGCGAHGDGIKFVMQMDNVEFIDAIKSLANTFGFSNLSVGIKAPEKPIYIPPAKPERNIGEVDWARRKLRQSVSAHGTLVENYLQSRGIDLKLISPLVLEQLRFVELDYYAPLKDGTVKNMGAYPVMLAPMQYRDDSVQAVHLTYLKPDGRGKAVIKSPDDGSLLPSKKMRGSPWACGIRLGPQTKYMAMAEGIETGLTFAMVRPKTSVWVAGSINNMAGKGVGNGEPHPNPKRANHRLPSVYPDFANPGLEMPHGVERVYLICDNDGKDQVSIDAQIERAARRIKMRRIQVSLIKPPEGCDLNDLVKAGFISGGQDAVYG